MKNYLLLLRPHQWLKNLILFFPVFLDGSLFQAGRLGLGVVPFAAFSLASSATYIVNDLRDREQDRHHPKKCQRPLASGAIKVKAAVVVALLAMAGAVFLTLLQPVLFAVWLLAYLLLTSAYSFGLKNQPILDIFCIASGFVFRLFAGGAVFNISVSNWLFLTVLLLALFLSCGKRLAEKNLLGNQSIDHRRALEEYPPGVLEGFMFMSGAAVLVTYTLYVISRHQLIYSVPLCCFGLFRYILLVKRGRSGDPTEALVRDPVLFIVGFVWVVMIGVVVYV